MTKALSHLPVGKTARIHEITTDYVTKERLESLGLIQGVEIKTIRKSPLGSPKIYQCLNTLVALRNVIAGQILVEVPHEHQ